jgi:hypothetical protein
MAESTRIEESIKKMKEFDPVANITAQSTLNITRIQLFIHEDNAVSAPAPNQDGDGKLPNLSQPFSTYRFR